MHRREVQSSSLARFAKTTSKRAIYSHNNSTILQPYMRGASAIRTTCSQKLESTATLVEFSYKCPAE